MFLRWSRIEPHFVRVSGSGTEAMVHCKRLATLPRTYTTDYVHTILLPYGWKNRARLMAFVNLATDRERWQRQYVAVVWWNNLAQQTVSLFFHLIGLEIHWTVTDQRTTQKALSAGRRTHPTLLNELTSSRSTDLGSVRYCSFSDWETRLMMIILLSFQLPSH